jgi:hypothetical protein
MTKRISIIIIILVIIIAISFLWFFWERFKTPGIVSFTTDKVEYEKGEVLKLKVKNDSLKKICFSTCYPYYLERKNSNWESYKYEECRSFNGNGHCLEAGKEKSFELTLPSVPAGIHRLAIPVCSDCENETAFVEEKRFYSNEFTIK